MPFRSAVGEVPSDPVRSDDGAIQAGRPHQGDDRAAGVSDEQQAQRNDLQRKDLQFVLLNFETDIPSSRFFTDDYRR